MTQIIAPSLIHNLLHKLEVKTVDDLGHININKVRRMPGVGKVKIRALEKLMSKYQLPVKETKVMTNNNIIPDDIKNELIAKTFKDIPARINNKISEYGLKTIEDLHNFRLQVDVLHETNYGRKTHSLINDMIEGLISNGVNKTRFGCEKAPTSPSEIIDTFINGIEDLRTKEIVTLRYREGKTLQEIGDSLKLTITRERVRQIISNQFEIDKPIYADLVGRFIDPLSDILLHKCPIYPLDEALKVTGAEDFFQINFLADLAGLDLHDYGFKFAGLIGIIDYEELIELRKDLASSMNLGENGELVEEINRYLSDYGFDLSDAEKAKILKALFNVNLMGTRYIRNLNHKGIYWEETLRASKKPLDVHQLNELMLEKYPNECVNLHNTSVHLHRNSRIFKSDIHSYIHEDNYWVPRNVLDLIVNDYASFVPKDGKSVNLKLVSPKINHRGYSVSPYTIRDILIKSNEYRSWRATCEVAFNVANSNRKNVVDMIYEVVQEMDQPFDNNELVNEVAKIGGFADSTVRLNIDKVPHIIMAQHGTSYFLLDMFSSLEEFETFRDSYVESLNPNQLYTYNGLPVSDKATHKLVKKYGHKILWSIVRNHPNMRNRIKGLFVWNKSLGDEFSDVIKNVAFFGNSDFTSEDLNNRIKNKTALNVMTPMYGFIKECVATGRMINTGKDRFKFL